MIQFLAAWIGLKLVILSEVSLTQKDKHHMIQYISGILKNDTNELSFKIETNSQT